MAIATGSLAGLTFASLYAYANYNANRTILEYAENQPTIQRATEMKGCIQLSFYPDSSFSNQEQDIIQIAREALKTRESVRFVTNQWGADIANNRRGIDITITKNDLKKYE